MNFEFLSKARDGWFHAAIVATTKKNCLSYNANKVITMTQQCLRVCTLLVIRELACRAKLYSFQSLGIKTCCKSNPRHDAKVRQMPQAILDIAHGNEPEYQALGFKR
jgi:hypothetical protein